MLPIRDYFVGSRKGDFRENLEKATNLDLVAKCDGSAISCGKEVRKPCIFQLGPVEKFKFGGTSIVGSDMPPNVVRASYAALGVWNASQIMLSTDSEGPPVCSPPLRLRPAVDKLGHHCITCCG